MNEVQGLLNFTFDPASFASFGQHIISKETQERLKRSIIIFQKITTESEKPYVVSYQDQGVFYRDFINLAPLGKEKIAEKFNSSRKTRMLAYSLQYSENPHPSIIRSQFLSIALEIINNHWRFSCFFGLFDVLLKNWFDLNNYNGKSLREFLAKKIVDYAGKRSVLQNIKKYLDYYTKANGASLLGGELVSKREKLANVWEFLGLPKYVQTYGYFSSVALAFTQTALRENPYDHHISDIMDFLQIQQNKKTSKQALCKVILKLEGGNDVNIVDQIKLNALKLIGDPAHDFSWQPWEGATQNEIEELKRAQNLLNEWITKECIILFFEKLVIDNDRKQFWLRYVKNISRFRIYGSGDTFSRLKNDNRLIPYLNARFGKIQGGGNVQSALVMIVKDYALVEFAVSGGAFYAYHSSNQLCPKIAMDSVHINDLRHPKQRILLMRRRGSQVYDTHSEGYFSHDKGWERFLSWWLGNQVGVGI